MSERPKKLECGCRVYMEGRGENEGRCAEGKRLEAELVEAATKARPFDGSHPEAEQRAMTADRAILAHDGRLTDHRLTADQSQEVDFSDPSSTTRARITEDELIVFLDPPDSGERRTEGPTTYTYEELHYPLQSIEWVSHLGCVNGERAIALGIGGGTATPGLRFADASKTEAFERALSAALEGARARTAH